MKEYLKTNFEKYVWPLFRFLFWRLFAKIKLRRMGYTKFHLALGPNADTETFNGRADIYRDMSIMLLTFDKSKTLEIR